MIIKAKYDQTITKAIRNEKGEVTGYEPTTLHYTFGSVGSTISGGFYVRVDELGKVIGAPIDPQKMTAIVPEFEINIFVRGDGKKTQESD